MATKEQIIAIYVKRNRQSKLQEVTLSDVVGKLDASDRSVLEGYIRGSRREGIANKIMEAAYKAAEEKAVNEANVLLEDDSLDLNELDSFL